MDLALPANKITKSDIILIISIVFIAVSIYISIAFYNSETATGFKIEIDGKLHSAYSFNDLKDGDTIEIKTEYGYNKFLYKNKVIKCIETDCTDKTEIYAGSINKPNQVLVCLPHKLIVYITGKDSIDAVSY